MHIEVDQSGKIEQTNKDTVVEELLASLVGKKKNDRGSPFVVGLDARQSSVR